MPWTLKFWHRDQPKSLRSLNEDIADKYGITLRPPQRNLNRPLIEKEDVDEDTTCIKIKYTLGSAFIFAGLGFLGGWLFFTKPWETSNHDDPIITKYPPPPPPANNGTHCPHLNATFVCPPLYPDRDFDDVLANGTVTDTGIPAGYDGYTLQIISLSSPLTNRVKVIAGIPGLQNDPTHADLIQRIDAYLHRPYLTTGVDFAYSTPPTPENDCLYRIGQWLAPGDPAYVPLNPEKLDAPVTYTTATKSIGTFTKEELIGKMRAKKNELHEKSLAHSTNSHAELNIFAQKKPNTKLEKLRDDASRVHFTKSAK